MSQVGAPHAREPPPFTFDRNLSHLNEDGVAELSELGEGLQPGADVHFIFFSYMQAVDRLLGVWLQLQLKVKWGVQNTDRTDFEVLWSIRECAAFVCHDWKTKVNKVSGSRVCLYLLKQEPFMKI